MTYRPRRGFLLEKVAKRQTPKSAFLRKLEKQQQQPSNVVSIQRKRREHQS